MIVAPSLTMNYRQISDWAAETPNSVGLGSNQQQSTLFWLPVTLGLTVGLLSGGIALAAMTALWLTSPTTNELSGVTSLSTSQWYHVAFVYDYSTSSQSIYLNGVLEGNRSSNPYKGMTGPILIGAIDDGTKYYFTGIIDQVSLITQAKTATEILNDATLVCYYSFDSNSFSDSGPLNLNGSGVNITTSGNGRIYDAISFASASSYFVIGGFTKLHSKKKGFLQNLKKVLPADTREDPFKVQ